MSTIGYVTTEYANEYVAQHFVSSDALRLSWESLDSSDREILLRRSFESIEALPFTGRKSEPAQTTAFPRYPSTSVPEAIKCAQVENAVALSDSSTTEEAAYYQRLWQYGVDSYSIGNLSESIGSGAWSSGPGIVASNGIVSAKAAQMLLPFMRGSYSIRGGRCS